MEAILKRQSIRKYTAASVPEPLVKQLLEAGMAAPSAGNERPWHFVVLTERQLLDQVPNFHPHAQMVSEATLAILVCCDQRLMKHQGYFEQDCAAATENILIAVAALGLGAVWLGLHPRPERVAGMRRLLNLAEEITPFALIVIGYPAETKPVVNRFDPERVHYNGW